MGIFLPAYQGFLGGAVFVFEFLFRDDFTTNESAPIDSPRTAEPGPGISTITDTGNNISIVSGELVLTGTGSFGQTGYVSEALTRAIGLAVIIRLRMNNLATISGFMRNTGLGSEFVSPEDGFMTFNARQLKWVDTSGQKDLAITLVNNTYYEWAIVLSSNGAKIIIKGGVFAEWTLLMVSVHAVNSTIYSGETIFHAVETKRDYNRVSQLPSPWDTDYGITTDRLAGARSAGDTFTHEADCLIEFEVDTVPSSGQIEMRFRIQDASNYWQVTIDSSGNLDLDEVVAGSPTQRGTSGGVIANSDRIMIIADDEVIKVYEANNLRITYSSAANFKTAVAGELETEGTGGAVSDIIAWPRTLSGEARSALDAVADA